MSSLILIYAMCVAAFISGFEKSAIVVSVWITIDAAALYLANAAAGKDVTRLYVPEQETRNAIIWGYLDRLRQQLDKSEQSSP